MKHLQTIVNLILLNQQNTRHRCLNHYDSKRFYIQPRCQSINIIGLFRSSRSKDRTMSPLILFTESFTQFDTFDPNSVRSDLNPFRSDVNLLASRQVQVELRQYSRSTGCCWVCVRDLAPTLLCSRPKKKKEEMKALGDERQRMVSIPTYQRRFGSPELLNGSNNNWSARNDTEQLGNDNSSTISFFPLWCLIWQISLRRAGQGAKKLRF